LTDLAVTIGITRTINIILNLLNLNSSRPLLLLRILPTFRAIVLAFLRGHQAEVLLQADLAAGAAMLVLEVVVGVLWRIIGVD